MTTVWRLALILLWLLWAQSYANEEAPSEKLKQLDAKMQVFQKQLRVASDKRCSLTKALKTVEEKIGLSLQNRKHLQEETLSNQEKIKRIQHEINKLSTSLGEQQRLLTEQVKTQYKMGNTNVMQWLFNPKNLSSSARMLIYRNYILGSRLNAIDSVATLNSHLNEQQISLKRELIKQEATKQQLEKNQQSLEQNKRFHQSLIRDLSEEIQSHQQQISEVEKNKARLAKLLATLGEPPPKLGDPSLLSIKHKLAKPVQVDNAAIRPLNQGLNFFAEEGSAVRAVYPGKVVFSGWLNGYGLLMIIDHGEGFMTLYAHNQALFKAKGDLVNQGDEIALVGQTGGIKQSALYFEVRVNGKATPPLQWIKTS